MPKLPTNMVKRKGRVGYYFRKKFAGRDKWIALGTDYGEAAAKVRKLRDDDFIPRSDLWPRTWRAVSCGSTTPRAGRCGACRSRPSSWPKSGSMWVGWCRTPASRRDHLRRRRGGFHVHQMRHTFACQWMDRGGSIAALQQILGHASIETTQRYARISDELVWRESARVFGGEVAKEVATNS
jgi:integrase-like protein